MTKQHCLYWLESYYNEMTWEHPWTFTEFVVNEWEQRQSLVENWDDDAPDKDSLSYYAGVLLGEVDT